MGLNDFYWKNFDCDRCGNCCKKLSNSLALTKREYTEWKKTKTKTKFGNIKLSEFAIKLSEKEYDLFYDPQTGEKLNQCPFLKEKGNKYYCSIYEKRPKKCKEFPFMENLVDLTREDICTSVKRIIEENNNLLEEIKMMIFKYFIKDSIEKR